MKRNITQKSILTHLSLLLLLTGSLQAVPPADLDTRIRTAVLNVFMDTFGVRSEQVRISYQRFPKQLPAQYNSCEITVSSNRKALRLGYQSMWVTLSRHAKQVYKFPVSFTVSIQRDVLVVKQRINRHAKILADQIATQSRWIDDDFNKYISDPERVIGNESTRVLTAGTCLTQRLIRPVPLVHRGERLELEVHAGQLVLTTPAIAKNDGAINQMILVKSLAGGNKLRARVIAQGKAVVIQENKNE